ncbi:MAG: SDR family oxidoreductase [Dehalococcoidales bacterium]|nr:SDR family oxidoreductase [Dehalococcoidales bacterium]
MAFNGHMLGHRPGEGAGAEYAAAKAGLVALTRALSFEVAARGITVNTVAPGPIFTEMQTYKSEAERERVQADTSIGHYGKPTDIAQAVLYLVGPDSDFVTGSVVNVNGGVWTG